jgi:hypothetical protein
MSINAAVAALNKEIEAIDKKRSRLVSLRDALVIEEGAEAQPTNSVSATKGKPGPKPGAKKASRKTGAKKPGPKPGPKTTTAKTATAPLKAATPKKRVMSPEAKKRIGEAVKARWAEKAKAKKAA